MHPWGSNGIMGRNANPRPPPILPLSAWRRSRDAESLGELEPPDLAIGEMHAGISRLT